MWADSAEIEAGSVQRCDVCVVGTGPAGLALAHQFMKGGLRVALLESGGFEVEDAVTELNQGTASGTVEAGWARGRVRVFGGSSHHWAGRCLIPNPTELGERAWIEHHAGWPFDLSTLLPWYEIAAHILTLPDGSTAIEQLPAAVAGTRLVAQPERTPAHLDLGRFYKEAVCAAPRVDLVTHATLTSLHQTAGRVTHADVARADGRRFQVRAKCFVVAAGLENARLLLLSESVLSAMPAASKDLVGRYLMGHINLSMAAQVTGMGAGSDTIVQGRFVALDRDAQSAHEILSAGFQLTTRMPTEEGAIERALRLTGSFLEPASRYEQFKLVLQTEQLPRPTNRIRLSSMQDRLGVPMLHVEMNQTEEDLAALERAMAALSSELGRLGVARVRHPTLRKGSGSVNPGVPVPDSHYMGSTRMHRDPERGVVDENARVHGLQNLFVAGSSVFPSGGWANPTWTLVALAARLGAHIRTLLEDA